MLRLAIVYFVQSMLAAIVAGLCTGVTYRALRTPKSTVSVSAEIDEAPTPEWVIFVFCGCWGLFTGILVGLQNLWG